MKCLVGELAFEHFALGDVAHVEHDAAHVLIVNEIAGNGLDIDPLVAATDQAKLNRGSYPGLLETSWR